jgi:hypothetical protein
VFQRNKENKKNKIFGNGNGNSKDNPDTPVARETLERYSANY